MSAKNLIKHSGLTALDDDVLDGVAGGFGEGGCIASGSFSSNTGTSLNLIVNWYVGVDVFGSHELMVVVGANSGNLTANSLLNGVELSVNGMHYAANNNAINYMGGSMTTNTLATFTIPNLYGTVSILAAWHFNGTYSGVYLGTIFASGTAYV